MWSTFTRLTFLFALCLQLTALQSAAAPIKATIKATAAVGEVDVRIDIPSQTSCGGKSTSAIHFTGTLAGTTFTWTNNHPEIGLPASGSGDIGAFTSVNNTNAPITATITVTPILNGASGTPATATILVNPKIQLNQPPDQLLISGAQLQPINFTGTPANTTYTWTNNHPEIGLPASGTGNVPSTPVVNETQGLLKTVITVTPSANGCVGEPVTIVILIAPKPLAYTPENQELCANTTTNLVTMNGTYGAGGTYTWTNDHPEIGLGANGTGDIAAFTAINTTQAPIVATITVVPSYQEVSGAPVSFTYTVNPTPIASGSILHQVCTGTWGADPLTSNVTGAILNWTNDHPEIGLPETGTGAIGFYAQNNTSTRIVANISYWADYKGCVSTAHTSQYTVYPFPIVTVPADATYCNGNSVPSGIFSNTVVGATYSWTNDHPEIGLMAGGTGNVPAFTAINNTAAPITATIRVVPAVGGCVGFAKTYTIVINPAPTVAKPASQTVCNGTATLPVTFAATVSSNLPHDADSYSWTNSEPAIGLAASGTGSIPSFSAVNSGVTPVVATITVTPQNGDCNGPSQTFTITVDPTPDVTAPADQSFCNGNATTLLVFRSQVNGTLFNWTNSTPEIGLAASGTGNIPVFTPVNNTNDIITAAITVTPVRNGCAGTPASFNIQVLPDATLRLPPSQAVCSGAATNAITFGSSTTNAVISWTNDHPEIGLAASGTGDITSFTATNNGSTPVIATLRVTSGLNGCEGASGQMTIRVNPPPSATITSGVQTVCAGTSVANISFSGTSGAIYNWTNSNPAIGLAASGTGNIPGFPATNNGGIPVTGDITVTPVLNGCAGTPVTGNVTVNPAVTMPTPANQTVLNNDAVSGVNFSGDAAGSTFEWINNRPDIGLAASGSGNIAGFTGVNNTGNDIVATITVTPAANGCIGQPVQFTITIQPTRVVTTPANQEVCNGDSTQLVHFIGKNFDVIFNWENDNTAIGLPAFGKGDIAAFMAINNGETPAVATITVTPSGGGDSGILKIFTIIVYPTPVVNVPASVVACSGTSVNAAFTSTVPGTIYNWTNDHPEIGLAASGTGNIAAFTTVNTTNTAIVANILVTPVLHGCPGTPKSFTITVKPDPVVSTPPNIPVCDKDAVAAVTFNANISGTTFSWTNDNTGIGLAAGGAGNMPAFTAQNNTISRESGNIMVTPLANGCTGHPQTFMINVGPLPIVAVPANREVCGGATVPVIDFTPAVSGALLKSVPSYNWTNDNTSIGLAASGTGALPSFTAINNGATPQVATITVTPVENGCNGASKTFTITVNPVATVKTPSEQQFCHGVATNVPGFTSNVNGTTYTWTNDHPEIGLAASGVGDIPVFTATNGGTTPVLATITVTPANSGCSGPVQTFTITVTPEADIIMPDNVVACNNSVVNTISFGSNTSSATFSWTNDNTGIGLATSGTGDLPAFTAVNTGTITTQANIRVTASVDGCPGATGSFVIQVNPTPDVAVSAAQMLCAGTGSTPVMFSGTIPGTVFKWTNDHPEIGPPSSGTGDIPSFAALNRSASAINSTITVTPVLNSCAGTPAAVMIAVNPPVIMNPPASQTVDNGGATEAVTFSASPAGATFSWTNDHPEIGLAASGAGDIAIFTARNITAQPITANIHVKATGNGCVDASQEFSITVRPTPDLILPDNQEVCNGDPSESAAFSSAVANPTFNWTNDHPEIGLAAAGSGDIDNFIARNTTTAPIMATITVTPQADGVAGAPGTFTIIVYPTPVITVPADMAVCNNSSITAVFTSNVAGTSFFWINDHPEIGLPELGRGDINGVVVTNTTTEAITATLDVVPVLNGCPGTSSIFTITVQPVPVVTAPASQEVCNNAITNAVHFTGATPGTTFTWSNNHPEAGVAVSGMGDIPAFTAVNKTTAPIVDTFTVVPSLGGCEGASVQFTITVYPTPEVDQPVDQQACNGDTVPPVILSLLRKRTIRAVVETFTWTNSNPAIGLAAAGAGDVPGFKPVNTGSTPDSAVITITPHQAGCDGISQTYTIRVWPTPHINKPTSQVVCNNEITTGVVFKGNIAGTIYNWTNDHPEIGLAGSGTGDIAAFMAVNTTDSVIEATITVTPEANGCTGTAQRLTITVNPTPVITVPSSQAVCNNAKIQPVAFTSNVNGTTFSWTNSRAIGLPVSGTGNLPVFTAVNHSDSLITDTITVTAIAPGQCKSQQQVFTISVKPVPVVNIPVSASQVVCNGDRLSATLFGGGISQTTYSWTNDHPEIGLAGSGSGNIPAFQAVNTTDSVIEATITVTPVANGCTGAAQRLTITVNPTAVITIPSSQTVCNNAKIQPVAFTSNVNGTTFSWTNSRAIGLPVSGTGNLPVFTAVNHSDTLVTDTITVTAITPGQCRSQQQVFTISVKPVPVVNVPVSASQVVCNGDQLPATLFGGGISQTTYSWTNDHPEIGLAGSGSGNIPAFQAVNTTDSVIEATITVTPVANGCTGTAQRITITVNPTAVITVPSSETVCNNAKIQPVAFTSNVNGTTFSWTNSRAIGLPVSGTGNLPVFTAVNHSDTLVTDTITVTAIAPGQCKSAQQVFTITVKPVPVVNIPVSASQVVCMGRETAGIVFSGNVTGTVFNWTNDNPAIGLATNGSGNINAFTATNNTATPLTAHITVTPVANGCNGEAQNFTITVNPAAAITDIVVTDVTTRYNTAAVLTASSTTISRPVFRWYSDAALTHLVYTGAQYTTLPLLNDTTFYVAVEGAGICQSAPVNAKSVHVTVTRPLEDKVDVAVRKVSESRQVGGGETFNYIITVMNNGPDAAHNITLTDTLPELLEYVSTTGAGASYNAAAKVFTWSLPLLAVGAQQDVLITVKALKPGEVRNTARVTTTDEDTDLSNNVSTDIKPLLGLRVPNVITPNGDGKNDQLRIIGLQMYPHNELYIYNRLGNMVYQQQNYSNDWDAHGLNEGTYFYVLKVTDSSGKEQSVKGYVLLVR